MDFESASRIKKDKHPQFKRSHCNMDWIFSIPSKELFPIPFSQILKKKKFLPNPNLSDFLPG